MAPLAAIIRRELWAYFGSPLAYVFIVIFLMLAGALTIHISGWLALGRADLTPFFQWHPWLYLILVPAVGMRLWAEEHKTGTIEFLMTLPVATWQAVAGKFLAAWLFLGVALALTCPMWVTVNVLGEPDNGVILAGYLGSWLTAGAMLALSATVSALTRHQVIAFVLAAAVCFLFMVSGLDLVQGIVRGFAPQAFIDLLAGISLLSTFARITEGVIDARHLILFASLIGASLFINVAIIELRRSA